jgi:hypothetical protein
VQYNAFLSAQLTLPNNFIAEAFAVENSARRTIQGSNPSFSIMGFGFKKQFMQKKLALGVNAIEPFNTYKNFNKFLSINSNCNAKRETKAIVKFL